MGLNSEEIWELTPLQFDEMYRRNRKLLSLTDSFTARIYCLLANMMRDEKKRPEPFEVNDLMVVKMEDDDGDDAEETVPTLEEVRRVSSSLKSSWRAYTDTVKARKEVSRGRVPRSKFS